MPTYKKIPEVSFFNFLRHSANIVKNPLPFHHQNFESKGDTFKLKIGYGKSVLFSRDAALAEYVLKKNQRNYTKSEIQTRDLKKYIGEGLLTSEGEFWKMQRKLIQPAFHKKQLSKLLKTIQKAIIHEYDRISIDGPIDIFPINNDLAFQTVVKSLFSSAANSKEISRLQSITESAQKMLVKELRQPYLNWWFDLSGKIEHNVALSYEAREILKRLVVERRNSGQRFDDLLDMLLETTYEDGSFMKDEQLVDEILVLFTAGHETTSNAITFSMQLLAKHPAWQDAIVRQTTELELENPDLLEFVSNSRIARQLVEEAMRLYPPVYFIDRVNIKEDSFRGMTFAAGTMFLFSIYEIHRHHEFWSRPEAFQPERFKDGGNQYSSHYFPFGAGPRKCIGNNFAMFEMVLAVTELLKRYRLKPEFKKIGIIPLITLKPKNAIIQFGNRI